MDTKNKKKPKNEDWAFEKGWYELKTREVPICRKKLMSALKLTTHAGFGVRLRGQVVPNVEEVQHIERIFHEFGITEIWGKIE
jgi:hypothetical protein